MYLFFRFNQNVERDRLEKGDGKIRQKIREGRVLPPLLRSLQLLLQRPETKIIVRPKIPGIFVETEKLPRGGRRLKFGTARVGAKGPSEKNRPKIAANLSEDSLMRCRILQQFGIMWLAPFCHRNPGNRLDFV